MASPALIGILGLPLAFWFGIIAFVCMCITAGTGILVLKGLYRIPFSWHMRMAAVTFVSAALHIVLVIWQFFL
jgi:hypothetical protein